MKALLQIAAGMLLSLSLIGGSAAEVLFSVASDQSGPNGWQSDGATMPYSQSFAVPKNKILESIRWWGYHGIDSLGSDYDAFEVVLNGDALTGTLAVQALAQGINEYTLDIVDIAIASSSLSIQNNSSDVEWYWQLAADIGNDPDNPAVAFEFIGRSVEQPQGNAVPEPYSMPLVFAGLLALGFQRKRRTQSKAPRR